MGLLDNPVATFTSSDLRKPEVVEAAQRGPVEIRSTSGDLVLVSQGEVERTRELFAAVQDLLRVMVELGRIDPTSVILGDLAVVADWPTRDRDQFLKSYIETVDLSIRANDPGPIRLFIDTITAAEPAATRPDFEGRVSPSSRDRIAARLSS